MTELDDVKNNFEKKLEAQRAAHSERLNKELSSLRSNLMRDFKNSLPSNFGTLTVGSRPPVSSPSHALVDLSGSVNLQDLDEAFIQTFNLGRYYPLAQLRYPTVYCESLEEFFQPLVKQMNLSASARQVELKRLVAEAQETAKKYKGGGIFGYNLPGIGAYLNGWLFTYGMKLEPTQAFSHPELARSIFATAAHEKLGHGFLFVYSALGQVKTRLGLAQFDIASRFGLRTTDDPTASLRLQQSNLLFQASQLLEEGWSTWVENMMVRAAGKNEPRSRYQIKQVVDAIQSLPANLAERNEIQKLLTGCLGVLFGEQPVPMESLHQAVMIVNALGNELNEYFSEKLGQPLRYVAGELIMSQAENNLGMECVPYAALIAANVSFDPAAISLGDLRDLLGHDPRLHPDARLAALSRLKLPAANDIPSLVRSASEALSISVPKELQ